MERSDNEIEFARLIVGLFAVGAVIPGGLSEAAYELKVSFEEVNRIFSNAIDVSFEERRRRNSLSQETQAGDEHPPGA
jgi:hypothetical protein